MIRLAIPLLLVALPAFAGPKITLTCADASIVVNVQGEYTITCMDAKTSAPPPPSPPAPPTPQPPVATLCVEPPGLQAHATFGIPGSPSIFQTEQGALHSWPLPKAAAGIIVSTATTTTPGTLQLEWSISKCPGDTAYYKTPAAAVAGRGGVVYHPCGSETGWESGGVKWSVAGGTAQCKVPAGEQWYVNLRYTAGCTGTCPIYRNWQVQ